MSTARRIGPSWCPLPTLGGRQCGDGGRAIIITSSNSYCDIGSVGQIAASHRFWGFWVPKPWLGLIPSSLAICVHDTQYPFHLASIPPTCSLGPLHSIVSAVVLVTRWYVAQPLLCSVFVPGLVRGATCPFPRLQCWIYDALPLACSCFRVRHLS
jgi:hypothetical protein